MGKGADDLRQILNHFIEQVRPIAAAHGGIGPAAAFAFQLGGNCLDDVSGMEFGSQLLPHNAEDRHLFPRGCEE